MAIPSKFGFRPRFTTKVLLVFMVLFGAILVPFVWRLERAKKQKAVVDEIWRRGGYLVFSNETPAHEPIIVTKSSLTHVFLHPVVSVSVYHPDQLSWRERGSHLWAGFDFNQFAALTELETLDVSDTEIDDLEPLRRLRNLRRLDLSNTYVRDLSPLSTLTRLEELNISRTFASDLSPLSTLTSLKSLDLFETGASDLSPLSGLRNLTHLSVESTLVTNVEPLRRCKNSNT